ncbi:MAG: nucleotidyltransferase domain-containing protein [Betaproteobacteria bacterium]|nr:nucleotidyltransferase domain-containing protein [Betaproteobacteria bacterium]
MPVRSLSSSVLKWPDRTAVDTALRAIAGRLAAAHPELLKLGYFGSYARGNWCMGSDLDIIAIVRESDTPFTERAGAFDISGLPVPVELLVYTEGEWGGMQYEGRRFVRDLEREAVWVFSRAEQRKMGSE